MTSNRAGKTQTTSSTMAYFIETIMHVLSFFCIFVIYGLYVMQDRLRPGMNVNDVYDQNPNRIRRNVGMGDPASIVDIITISLIVGFFMGLSNFVSLIGGGEEAVTGKSKLSLAILAATLFFFATCYAFNQIRWQNRLAEDYSRTKKGTKSSNSRANTVAAFLTFELILTFILAVLAAGVKVPGSSDKKKEETAEGAPAAAEAL